MTLQRYINSKFRAGQFPNTYITPFSIGSGVWIEDENCIPLAHYINRETAEKAKSKAMDWARKTIKWPVIE